MFGVGPNLNRSGQYPSNFMRKCTLLKLPNCWTKLDIYWGGDMDLSGSSIEKIEPDIGYSKYIRIPWLLWAQCELGEAFIFLFNLFGCSLGK